MDGRIPQKNFVFRLSMGTLKPNKSEQNSTTTLTVGHNGERSGQAGAGVGSNSEAKIPRNESKKSIRNMISR